MILQFSLVLSLALLGQETAATSNFMDCPGNNRFFGLLRRCCSSDQLPKGCECFDISSKTDFGNTLFHRPKCPEKIQTKFTIFTRSNRDNGVIIRAGKQNIEGSPLSSGKKTLFVTHGYTDVGNAPWLLEMKNALLTEGDFNVILVDWKEGAKAPNYYQAAANTRTVGAMVARLIQDINLYKGVSFDNYHLIGHSLGAHIMGSAGKEIQRLTSQNIGRISGMDPAGPSFEKYSANVRLDKSDALFVDIIHTDAEPLLSSGFGIRKSIGHVDFYANGGKHQPGCPKETYGIFSMLDFEDEMNKGACSHGRVVEYFTNSIAKCRYDPPNGDASCTMGYHVSESCKGDYYPVTGDSQPYC